MTTIPSRRNFSAAAAAEDTRTAGGKITRNRRPPASSRTPYARPSPSSAAAKDEEIENPNWLSNLIYPAKVIVSGAGKILSFFGNDSELDSEDDDDDDDDDDFENDEDDVDEVENDESDKVSVNKRKIEQLVLEETFSREEGNQLIRLIKSRMGGSDGTPAEGTRPTRNTAIMEARKWLQEKRSGSKKKSEAELDSSSQFTRSEKGSPADMAKSYMQNRPAWASPSLKHAEFGSPSALGVLHFKDETPTSTLRSSEQKRSSFAAGSWNLLDEIRRVRSKATEEFPAATSLRKTNLSLFSPPNKQDIYESKRNVETAGPVEATHVEPDNVLHDAVANSLLRDTQDGNAVQSVEHQDYQEVVDVSDLKYNKDNEVNESRSTPAENGVAPPGYVYGENGAEKPKAPEEENGNQVSSSQVGQDVQAENSNILTEPIDIPCTTTIDIALNGSQNSSSLQREDVSQDFSQPITDGPTAKANVTQKERKLRGNARKGRGRGK